MKILRAEQTFLTRSRKDIETGKVSMSALAEKVGISQPTLSLLLSGRSHMSLETFAKFCQHYGAALTFQS